MRDPFQAERQSFGLGAGRAKLDDDGVAFE